MGAPGLMKHVKLTYFGNKIEIRSLYTTLKIFYALYHCLLISFVLSDMLLFLEVLFLTVCLFSVIVTVEDYCVKVCFTKVLQI